MGYMRTIIPPRAVLIPKQATRVFKGIIYDVYQWQQKQFDGSETTFEMLKRPDTVKIIAIKNDKIVMLEQEQPNHPLFYDIPGGMHTFENETELDAAKRELLEETGMSFKTWKLLQVSQFHNKIEQFLYIFLATDFETQTAPKPDAGEKIKVKLVSFDEALELAENEKNRYIPKDILTKAGSIKELINLSEYTSRKF
jgi:ADP-ribose pyrophosphatase